jgi:hypothetical protein
MEKATLAAMLDFKSAPNLVEGHPMNISGKFWLKSVQRFQRRRVKCEKLTDGRTITNDKSSHGL